MGSFYKLHTEVCNEALAEVLFFLELVLVFLDLTLKFLVFELEFFKFLLHIFEMELECLFFILELLLKFPFDSVADVLHFIFMLLLDRLNLFH